MAHIFKSIGGEMFEAKPELALLVEKLIVATKPLKRGEIIGHETIQAILHVAPHTEHWQPCIKKLKRHMEQTRGITLWSEPGIGYKLCTIQEQLEMPHIRLVWARRHVKRGIQSIDVLPKSGLTLHQQSLRAAQSASLRKNHRELSSAIHRRHPVGVTSAPLSRPKRTSSTCTIEPEYHDATSPG